MNPGKPESEITPGRSWCVIAFHAIVLLVGLGCAFRPTLLSGGARLQTDPGDTLLNHYILEHSWLWLTEPGYVGTLWSPPCFYPKKLTLAYSENLLGTAPLYWLLRVFTTPVLAYAGWMMLVCALTYTSAVWALRRFGLQEMTAAFGAFVFAFGLPRAMQIGHQQLLPDLFSPIAVYCTWQFVVQPRLLPFAGLLAASYLQVLSSICLGWFLLFGLGVFFVWLLATHRGSVAKLAAFVRHSWLPSVGLLAGWALLMALLLNVYREANQGFQREWYECANYLPWLSEWLVPHDASLWATLLSVKAGSFDREGCICPGWIVLAMVVLGLGLSLSRSRLLAGEQSRLVLALLGTTLTLMVLSLHDHGWGTLWWYVYQWIPGATALRAVGRIVLIVQLFALIGGLLTLEAVLRAPARLSPRTRTVLVALVLLLGGLEQGAVKLPSFETASFYQDAQVLGTSLDRGTTAYLAPRPDMARHTSELLAMWAGLHANRPVVNGYSGRVPETYPNTIMAPGRVFGWLAANTPPNQVWPGRLLYVMPTQIQGEQYRFTLLEADRVPAVAR